MGPDFDLVDVLDHCLFLYMEGTKVHWQGVYTVHEVQRLTFCMFFKIFIFHNFLIFRTSSIFCLISLKI